MTLEKDPAINASSDQDSKDEKLVAFHGPTDPSNPLDWVRSRKWAIVTLLSLVNLIANLATVMCIPATPQILHDFSTSNRLLSTILVSVWEVGEAIGPLLTAPLSEIFGRLPLYNATNVVFVVFSIACAVSSNIDMLIAFRFLNGIGDASQALNASIVGDLFVQEERGLAIAVMGFPPLVGPVAGPVIGGYLAQSLGWRWNFWLSAIMGAVCEVGFLVLFRETYEPAILRKKAARLRKKSRSDGFYSKHDFTRGSSVAILRDAIVRPAMMLMKSPIVLLLAGYISIVTGYLYVLFTTITNVFEDIYHFSEGAAGLAYLGLSVGMIIGVILCAFTLDWYLKKAGARYGSMKPEYRLPPMVLGGIIIPLGLFLYGWTAEYHVFYIVPMIGTATVGFGFFVTTIPLQAYLVDAYKVYAASAISATLVSRCLVSAAFPLAGPPLYEKLGNGWGNSVLGFIALGLVPIPIFFMYYGESMRKRWKVFATE